MSIDKKIIFSLVVLITPGFCIQPTYAQKMYWGTTSPGTIQRANLDGTNVEILVDQGLFFPSGIAIDRLNKKIYWTNQGQNFGIDLSTVQRANLDGTNVETIYSSTVDIPFGLSIDMDRQKIYWLSILVFDDVGKLQFANMDGSNITIIVDTLYFPTDCAIDPLDKKIYWIDSTPDTVEIQRSRLDGTNIEDLVTLTGPELPTGLALDLINQKMYWTDFITNSIHRSNIDGTMIEEFITQTALSPEGIDLDVMNNKIYWTDGNNIIDDYGIARADLDGSNAELLVELGAMRGVVLALDLCGDGNINLEEECDMASGNSDILPDTCRTNCLNPSCGDEVVDTGETCDDGGETAFCTNVCTVSTCGDGIINETAGEICDDGNLIDFDHCTNACTIGPNVPTVSQWGLMVMALFILCMGGIIVQRNKNNQCRQRYGR